MTSTSNLQPLCNCSLTPDDVSCTPYTFVIPSFGHFDRFGCAEIPHSQGVKADTQQVFVSTAVKVHLRSAYRSCEGLVTTCVVSRHPAALGLTPHAGANAKRNHTIQMQRCQMLETIQTGKSELPQRTVTARFDSPEQCCVTVQLLAGGHDAWALASRSCVSSMSSHPWRAVTHAFPGPDMPVLPAIVLAKHWSRQHHPWVTSQPRRAGRPATVMCNPFCSRAGHRHHNSKWYASPRRATELLDSPACFTYRPSVTTHQRLCHRGDECHISAVAHLGWRRPGLDTGHVASRGPGGGGAINGWGQASDAAHLGSGAAGEGQIL